MASTTNITGGCLCGSIRFSIDGSVGSASYCHCTDSQKCTGSAFNISVPVAVSDFNLVAGTPKGYAKVADSGHELTRHFCSDCGSQVFTSSPRHLDRIYVKAGAFDDANVVTPVHQSWTGSAVSWSSIPPNLPSSVNVPPTSMPTSVAKVCPRVELVDLQVQQDPDGGFLPMQTRV